MNEELRQLQAQVAELYRKAEALAQGLGNPVITQPGTSDLTDTITIGDGGGSADVPKAYLGTILVIQDGYQYEVPYLTKTPS